jgi:lipoic acid synthetase
MPADKPSATSSRKPRRLPEWIRVALPQEREFARTRGLVQGQGLHTVCQSARCPNVFECFSCGTATFLIMGGECTRDCAFCNIAPGTPEPLDADEPRRLAQAAADMDLRHVVITSVTRDDLPDGGAAHFAAVISELHRTLPGATVEVLVPDFQGDRAALETVLQAGPAVLNHNVETVPRLYPRIRPQAVYGRSLEVLERAARWGRGVTAKGGLMVGLGETDEEVRAVIRDLAGAGCGLVTVGQYLRPSRKHPEPERYVHPDVFQDYAAWGRELGMRMFCGPLVRSSYHAAEHATGRE